MRDYEYRGSTPKTLTGAMATLLVVAAAACEPIAPNQPELDCNYAERLYLGWGISGLDGTQTSAAAAKEASGGSALARTWDFEDSAPVAPFDSVFCFADETGGGYPQTTPWPAANGCPIPIVTSIEEGGLCAEGDGVHTRATVLRADAHNFWGGAFMTWSWNQSLEEPVVADCGGEPCEGIALFAKSDPDADKFVMIQLSDATSYDGFDDGATTQQAEGNCIAGVATGANTGVEVEVEVTVSTGDGSSQNSTTGTTYGLVPATGQCGNPYQTVLETTDQWQLHFLPFSGFTQKSEPNRIGKIDPSKLFQLSFWFGGGKRLGLHIDELFFYRQRNIDEQGN